MTISLAQIKRQVHGAVFDTITRETLNSISVIIPDDLKVKQFETIIAPSFQKILTYNFQTQTLAELRDALLPKLMNGKVRVNGFKDYLHEP